MCGIKNTLPEEKVNLQVNSSKCLSGKQRNSYADNHSTPFPQSPPDNRGLFSQVAFTVGLNTRIVGKCSHTKLSYSGAWQNASVTMTKLAQHISLGHPWMPGLLGGNGKRNAANVVSTAVMVLDFDGGSTIEQALTNSFIAAHAGLIQESSRSTPELHKFRVVFRLAEPIQGGAAVGTANQYLLSLFPEADQACKDACRFFFGGLGREPRLLNEAAVLPASFAADAIAWQTERDRQWAERKAEQERKWAHLRDSQSGDEQTELVRSALDSLRPYKSGEGRYSALSAAIAGLCNERGTEGESFAIAWDGGRGEWGRPFEKWLASLLRSNTGKATLGSLFHLAKAEGWQRPQTIKTVVSNAAPITTRKEVDTSTEKPAKKTAEEIARMAAHFRSKNPDFYGLTCDRTVTNERYVSINLSAPASVLAISSDVSTGKTEVLKQLKKQFFELHPDGYFDEQGYRNGLLRQKCERNGGDHIRDLECSDSRFSQALIDDSRELNYCLDSLERRAPALMRAIAEGKRVCISFDEADAIVKHLAGGGTLNTRQAKIWLMWCDLLKAVIAGNGYIVALEADLSQISVDAIAEAAGNPKIVAIENTHKPHAGRQVINHTALNPEGEPSDNLLEKACHIDVINAALGIDRKAELDQALQNAAQLPVRTRQRVFLATDAQKLGRQVEAGAKAHGLKVLRIDRETSELKPVQDFLKNPDAEVQKHEYDIVIVTTTAESGLSISDGYFDYVALYGSHLENRALKQLSARVRGMVPLHTYIRSRAIAIGEDPDSFTADGVLKAHEKNKADSAIAADVAQHLGTDALMKAGAALATPEAVSLHKWQATFAARKNLSGAFLRANTLHLFEAAGCVLSEHVTEIFNSEDETAYKFAREAVVNERTDEYVTRPTDKSVSWAAQKLSANGCTYLESVEAQKILDADAWPGLPFNDPKFVKDEIVKKRKQGLKAHTFGWLCQNPKIAKLIDLKSWRSQLEQPFMVVSALRRESAKVKILAQSALAKVAALDTYTENSPLIVELAAWAKQRAETLGRLFRLQIRPQHTNIQTINKLLRKIGYVSRKGKQLGSDGDRTHEWTAEAMPFQAEVFEALSKKWETELAAETLEVAMPEEVTQPTRIEEYILRVGCVSTSLASEQGDREPIPIPQKPKNIYFETQDHDPLAADFYDAKAWGFA